MNQTPSYWITNKKMIKFKELKGRTMKDLADEEIKKTGELVVDHDIPKPTFPPKGSHKKFHPSYIEVAYDEASKGATAADISIRLNISQACMRRYLHKYPDFRDAFNRGCSEYNRFVRETMMKLATKENPIALKWIDKKNDYQTQSVTRILNNDQLANKEQLADEKISEMLLCNLTPEQTARLAECILKQKSIDLNQTKIIQIEEKILELEEQEKYEDGIVVSEEKSK